MAHRSLRQTEPPPPAFDEPPWSGMRRAFDHVPSSGPKVTGALIGAVVVALVGWWFLRPAAPPTEGSLPMAVSSDSGGQTSEGASSTAGGGPAAGASTSTTMAEQLVVQAAGQVTSPGVYHLPVDARVVDLVDQAGGLTKDADRERVNLAAPLVDGERVWFPAKGQDQAPDVVAGSGAGAPGTPDGSGGGTGTGGAGSPTPTSPVDLNRATAAELDALPGVGPATAAAILAYRDQNGSFSSVDELLEVRGIGEAKLEQIRPLVRV